MKKIVRLFLLALALAYRRSGNHDAAFRTIDRAIAHGQATGEKYLEAEHRRLRGELLYEITGDREEAALEIAAAFETARRRGMRTYEVRALSSLVALGPVTGVIDDPLGALSSVLGWFGDQNEPFLDQARACVSAHQ